MRVRSCLAVVVLVAVGALPHAGAAQDDRQDLFLLPHGHVAASLTGAGWQLTGGPAYDVTAGSPAALAGVERPGAGLAYRLGTHVDDAWIHDIGYDAHNGLWPQAAGTVVPVGDWRFGLGYGQWYRGAWVRDLEVTTPLQPSGTGETYEVGESSRGEAVTLAAARRWSGPTWRVGVGARAGLLRLVHRVKYGGSLSGSLYGPGWAFGGRVQARPSAGFEVQVDAFYQGRSVLLGEVGPDDEPERDNGCEGGHECIDAALRTSSVRHRQPARVGLGTAVQLASRWQVRAEMLQVLWAGVQDNYSDQGEWTVAASFAVTPGGLLSLSYYRAGRDFVNWSSPSIDGPERLTAHYLAAGGRVRLGRMQADAAVADSRLLSSSAAGRTVVQVGASMTW